MTPTDEQIEEIKARAEPSRAFWKEGKQMADAPERIRVAQDADGFWTCREAVSGSQEYVRADLYAALEARLAEARQAVALFEDYGCPVCHGDCASANPPVCCCPMQIARRALEGAE